MSRTAIGSITIYARQAGPGLQEQGNIVQTQLQQSHAAAAGDPLLRPFQLKGLRLRNRIISTSHASMLDDGGLPLERYQRYHEEKARGGLAMTMIGGSAMTSPDSSWGGGQINLADDSVIPHLGALAQRVHAHGAAVMCQVSHLGRRATALGSQWLPAIAPSRVREVRTRSFPREMDRSDIDRVVADYALAARRCRDAGLDGIETLAGAHLIGQFFSPRVNRRDDSFGGSTANRARFGLMVHEAIRKAVGDDMPVGLRFVINEGCEDGLHFEECAEIARLFEAEGHIDFFNCIYGLMDSDLLLAEYNMPGLYQKDAPFLDEVAQFRDATGLPLIHAAAIRDVATARHIIREDIVDLVGMTRAHIADPQIVNKIMRGEEDHIRPCVGASYCLYRKVNCIHNPSTGRETVLPHEVPQAVQHKRAVVVGAGPAGLEAARVLALRGHEVSLFEASARPGGQILLAASAPQRESLIAIIAWREAELERLGVDIRYNSYAEKEDILALAPDIVVIATGGVPDLDDFAGAQYCDSTWDILGGMVPARSRILVYDGAGRHAAPTCALKLAGEGHKLSFVTADEAIAVEMSYIDRSSIRKKFYEHMIPVLPDHRLVRVERKDNVLHAVFANEMTGIETTLEADQVIVERGSQPVDMLYHELRAASANDGVTDIGFMLGHAPAAPALREGFVLHRIGDAVASRDIHASILEAFRLSLRL